MEESEQDPYDLFRKVMEITGLAKNDKAQNDGLFLLLTSWLMIALVIEVTSVGIYVLEDHSFYDKCETLQCLVSAFNLTTRIFNLRIRRSKFKFLIDESTAVWREMSMDKGNHKLLREIRKDIDTRIRFLMGLFILASPSYAAISIVLNLSLEPGEKEPPFKIWDPFRDTLGKDFYFSRLAYSALIFGHALAVFGALYAAYYIPCLMAASQMRVLARMLSSKDLDVTACVKLHQKNRKFVNDISELFSGQMFLEIVGSAIPITLRCYQLIPMLKNFDPEAFGLIYFLNLCFAAPLIVCLSGQMISDASEKLFLRTYQNEWYNLNLKDSKALCIMMTQASSYLDLRYKTVMVFNMERYMMVMQATYSYITILLNN